MNISTSCTADAMTTMNEIRLRYGASIAARSRLMPQTHVDVTSMTNVTAAPMRVAVSIFPDTPRNGQIPRKYASTKLLTKVALSRIVPRESELMTRPSSS
jgi:hypothetical protein